MRKALCLVPIMLLMLSTSCTLMSKFHNMSPKHYGAWMMNVYNAEFAALCVEAESYPMLSDEMKLVLIKKRDILVKVYPMIKAYVALVDAGGDPSTELFDDIVIILNELLELNYVSAPVGQGV